MAARFDRVPKDDDLVESCLDHVTDATDCATMEMQDPADNCVIFVGDLGEGERCNPHAELPGVDVEECAEGLKCRRGTCRLQDSPTMPAVAGESCDPVADTICNSSNLYCADNGTCRVRSGDGETCSSPFDCYAPEAVLHCAGAFSGTGTCSPIPGIGAACEPLDHEPCVASPVDGEDFAWCNPSTRVCEAGRAPAICEALDFPLAWP
jgi:hypothetical protein